jgi:hypothetical protein
MCELLEIPSSFCVDYLLFFKLNPSLVVCSCIDSISLLQKIICFMYAADPILTIINELKILFSEDVPVTPLLTQRKEPPDNHYMARCDIS